LSRGQKDGAVGIQFESYALHLLRTGGTFKIRKLVANVTGKNKKNAAQNKNIKTLNIKSNLNTEHITIQDGFSIPGQTQKWYIPAPSFPCVDLAPEMKLFQITISKTHGIKQVPLKKILEKLPVKGKTQLFFVVPDQDFEDYPLQKYLTETQTVSNCVPKFVQEHIEQWVLGIEFCTSEVQREQNKRLPQQSEVSSKNKKRRY